MKGSARRAVLRGVDKGGIFSVLASMSVDECLRFLGRCCSSAGLGGCLSLEYSLYLAADGVCQIKIYSAKCMEHTDLRILLDVVALGFAASIGGGEGSFPFFQFGAEGQRAGVRLGGIVCHYCMLYI